MLEENVCFYSRAVTPIYPFSYASCDTIVFQKREAKIFLFEFLSVDKLFPLNSTFHHATYHAVLVLKLDTYY